MTTKKILIVNGHPGQTSLSRSMAEDYTKAAQSKGHIVSLLHIGEMDFDPDFGQASFKGSKPLEADLQRFIGLLTESDHFVLITPMWWGSMPAKLKGLFDRSFLPGNSFDPRNKTTLGVPAPLLTGKTARMIVTSDTPSWAYRVFYDRAMMKNITRQILAFVGIKPTKYTHFTPASEAPADVVKRWRAGVTKLGLKAA